MHLVSYGVYSGPLPSTVGLALAQRALGHTVFVAYDRKPNRFRVYHEEPAAARLEPLALNPPAALTCSFKASPLELWRDVWALRRLALELDVVHAHLSHDHTLMALMGKAPVKRVRTIHAERSLRPRWGQRWLMRRAHAFIVRSQPHRDALLRNFALPKEWVRVVAGGIDAGAFTPATPLARSQARQRFGVPAEAPLVVQAALLADRGQLELVEAAHRLDGLYVLLAGAGPSEPALRAKIAQAGLDARVQLTGYLDAAGLAALYAAADAVFVAQPGNDASARAALEGMASGLPVLAVCTGALSELIDDEVGYPLATRAPDHIAAGLVSWLGDLAGGRARGAAGRERVERERSFTREAALTLALYAALG